MAHLRFVSALMFLVLLFSLSTESFAQEREDLEKKIGTLMKKLKAREAEFFEPSEEDKATFANYLRQPDTGLLRLMPREKYDGKLLTRGGGAYFSFTRLVHEYGYGSDISLEQNKFSVGFAGLDFGFLTELGDVPIETVNLEHQGVEFLANYAPPIIETEIRDQQHASSTGIQANGFNYQRDVDAKNGNTYVLRAINYRESDLLVVFRVTRQDTDGSHILLWQILKRFPVPEVSR
jgi:hypothetical protein